LFDWGGGAMNNVIQFPEAPKLSNIESFPIYMNHDTMKIMMPFVPKNMDDAAFVLGNFITILREDRILTDDQILQVALQATTD
jgi:hypothetical protein